MPKRSTVPFIVDHIPLTNSERYFAMAKCKKCGIDIDQEWADMNNRFCSVCLAQYPYSLTLTPQEQRAIDWIGSRYAHGNDLYKLLCQSDWYFEGVEEDDQEWGKYQITFRIPENLAWQIVDIIEGEDKLVCFSESFQQKLWEFAGKVV